MRPILRYFFILFFVPCSLTTALGGWQKLNSGAYGTLNCVTVHHSSSTGKLWVCGDGGVILYSSNGGDIWSHQNSGTTENLHSIIFKEVVGGPVFAAGAHGTILRTTDDGTTWTAIPSGTVASLRDLSDFGWIIVGDSGVVLKSTDDGLTWARKPSGTTERLNSVADAFSGYAVGENGTILRALNGGESWQRVQSGVQENLRAVPMFGSMDFIFGSGGMILSSTNFGASWHHQSSGTNSTLRSAEFSANNTTRLYAVGDKGAILKTTDTGRTWGRQQTPTKANLRSVFFYLSDDVGFACGDSGTILRTTDGGGSVTTSPLRDMFPLAVGNSWDYDYRWSDEDEGGSSSFVGSAKLTIVGKIDGADSIRWLMKERKEGLYCTGSVWPPSYDTCFALSDSIFFDLIERTDGRHRLYRTQQYVWESTVPFGSELIEPTFLYRYAYPDSASTLRVLVTNRPVYGAVLYSVVFQADSGILSLDDRNYFLTGSTFGAHSRLKSGILTGASEQEKHLPMNALLFQNYPNPFNPVTTINYQLSTINHVSLKVFDMLGREVATLVDEVQGPGSREVQFDAHGLASGVYYYRLVTGPSVLTRSMVLMR